MLTGRCTADPHKTVYKQNHTRGQSELQLCALFIVAATPRSSGSFGVFLLGRTFVTLPLYSLPVAPHFALFLGLGGPSESPWGKSWGCSWGQAGLDPPKGLVPAWSCLRRCVGSVLRPHLQLCLRAVPSAFSAPCSEAWSPASSRAHQGWGGWCGQQLLSWYDLSGLPLLGTKARARGEVAGGVMRSLRGEVGVQGAAVESTWVGVGSCRVVTT